MINVCPYGTHIQKVQTVGLIDIMIGNIEIVTKSTLHNETAYMERINHRLKIVGQMVGQLGVIEVNSKM
jgi:hypothetical protein